MLSIDFEFANFFNGFKSIDDRHVQVHQDQTGPLSPRNFEGLPSIFRLELAVAF
jgi:hypothetical protein